MTTHLSPDELVAAVDDTLAASARTHLASCARCQTEVNHVQSLLREVQGLAVPEPSPLFWDHFSARVHAAIGAEEAPQQTWWPNWLRAPVLVPVAALALMIMTLSSVVSRAPRVESTPPSPVTTAADVDDLAAVGEQDWMVLSELVGVVDLESASEAGIVIRPGVVESAVAELTVAEQRELLRLLQAEIDKAGD